MTDEPPKSGDEREDELAARLSAIEEKAKQLRGGPSPPDQDEKGKPWGDRIEQIEDSARRGRAALQRASGTTEKERRLQRENARGLGLGLTIAYVIVGLPLLGVLLGYGIDSALGTQGWRSGLALVGAVAGIALAVAMSSRPDQPR